MLLPILLLLMRFFVGPSAVPITYEGVVGCTATSINQDQGYWLTADHCISDNMAVGGQVVKGLKEDKENDLAIVQTEKGAPALPVAVGGRLRLGDDIVAEGFPHQLGGTRLRTEGKVIALGATGLMEPNHPLTLVSAPSASGMSGSAMTHDGKIVGVLQGGAVQWGGAYAGASPEAVAAFAGPYATAH